jgi:hypothetical protein
MKTERAIQMTLLVGALAMAFMVSTPRPAQASDAGKIIGALVAGAIVYELLDDDGGHHVYRQPVYAPPYGPAYGRRGFLDTRPNCQAYRGGGQWRPVRTGYRAPVYYEPPRSAVRVDVRKHPKGKASVGITYREYHR